MKVKLFSSLVVIGISGSAFSSGFGLYEASVKSYALGGSVLGRAVDASANFHNPATLTDFTNMVLTVGFVTEHPRGSMKVRQPDGSWSESYSMNPGCFWLPHLMFASPLPADFAFGLGVMPEYGLGSKYGNDWPLRGNSVETTVLSFTINPNLAYRITDDWSVAAGIRWLFFDFEQYQKPLGMNGRLKGDNRFQDLGWQIGTSYRITDSFSLGAVYKSHTDVHVRGSSSHDLAPAACGSAETEIRLPQSVAAGFNWDVLDTVHFGAAAGWTQWSSIDVLDFQLGSIHKPINLEWEDTWRFAFGASWDFHEDWTVMGSYVFETDCCGNQSSTMLPASDRHMITLGLAWNITPSLELAVNYGIILMNGRLTESNNGLTSDRVEYEAVKALSHAAGASLTYRF